MFILVFGIVLFLLIVVSGINMVLRAEVNMMKKRNAEASRWADEVNLLVQNFYRLPIEKGNAVLSREQLDIMHGIRRAGIMAFYSANGYAYPYMIRRKRQTKFSPISMPVQIAHMSKAHEQFVAEVVAAEESATIPHDYSLGNKPSPMAREMRVDEVGKFHAKRDVSDGQNF